MLWFALIFAINVEASASLIVMQGDFASRADCKQFVRTMISEKLKTFPEIQSHCLSEKQIGQLYMKRKSIKQKKYELPITYP